MEKNVELIKDLYAAIGSGDLPTVVGRMSEDIEIHLPGPPEIPFAGTFRGHAGVGQFFQALGTSVRWDDRQLEAREFIAQDDQVVVLGHETLTAEPTGRSWDTDWAMVWTVRDGKVVALREFHQTDAIAAAYR